MPNLAPVILFDAYGTLFDVYSIAQQAEACFPTQGKALAEQWRTSQIDYTRLRTLSQRYENFWQVTQDALVFSCRKLGLNLTTETRQILLAEYEKLSAFSENLNVLKTLKQRGVRLGILSNGTPAMLNSAIQAAGFEGLFEHVLSVEAVRQFKTAPAAYQLGVAAFQTAVNEMVFVSSNAWDVCGATWFGYRTFWLNRAQAPLEELGVRPHGMGRTMNDLLLFLEQA